MGWRAQFLCFSALLSVDANALARQSSSTVAPGAAATSAPVEIRESRRVRFGGKVEVWRLQWMTKPQPACAPDDAAWYTCPCVGFAFGQQGRLEVARLRDAKQIDALDLGQFFGYAVRADEGFSVVMQKMPIAVDFSVLEDETLSPRVAKRSLAGVLTIADYNHDGQASEFVLVSSSLPCGHTYGTLIGVTPTRPDLHAFGSVAAPDKPIELPMAAWKALRTSRGPVHVVEWTCGDHGSSQQIEINVQALRSGLKATRSIYSCLDGGKRGALVETEEF